MTSAIIKASYALLSNTVHANSAMVYDLFTIQRTPGQQPSAMLNRRVEFHEKLLRLVVSFFYEALTRTLGYFGARPTQDARFGHTLDIVLPGLFGLETTCGCSLRGAISHKLPLARLSELNNPLGSDR